MDFGNIQQGITKAVLVVISLFMSTFHPPSSPEIISPLQTSSDIQSVSISIEPTNSSPSAKINKINIEIEDNHITSNVEISNDKIMQDEKQVTPLPISKVTLIIPSLTPTATPTATPTLTPIPTTTKVPEIVLHIPTPQPTTSQQSLNADTILELINAHRKQLSYTAFEKDEILCELAKYRGPQLAEEIFVTGAIHKGLYDLNLPFIIIENMASYSSEQQVFNWWMNSKLHRSAIEGNYKYSCGVCNGNSCAQLFTNYDLR